LQPPPGPREVPEIRLDLTKSIARAFMIADTFLESNGCIIA
jgi:hypothetical protein